VCVCVHVSARVCMKVSEWVLVGVCVKHTPHIFFVFCCKYNKITHTHTHTHTHHTMHECFPCLGFGVCDYAYEHHEEKKKKH